MAAYQYLSADDREAVVFAFLQSQHFGSEVRNLRLQGLDPKATYEVQIDDADYFVCHGSTLMNLGVPLTLRGDYKSMMIRVKRMK